MKSTPARHQLCLPLEGTPPKRAIGSLPPSNEEIAGCLAEIADLLQAQGANPFRVRAYRTAAKTLRDLDQPVGEILKREGVAGLVCLPGVGRSLAHTIDQLARTGRVALLERLRGEDTPQRRFATVADIGPGLAQHIHDQLGIETLADLQRAANDGRLAQVPGMGPKRIRAVRESLAGRFARARPAKPVVRNESTDEPPVADLLDVDRQYRLMAELGRLPRIAPRRFNPTKEAWLPVMRTRRGHRHYTALYSNTARAHELGTTRDWVVISRDDNDDRGQWTVITGGYGDLRNRRIVRGREAECAEYYQQPGGSFQTPDRHDRPTTD